MDGLEAGSITPQPQPADGTYAPKIATANARIDWSADAEVIDRAVRAHTPAPGAWTMRGEDRFKVGPLTITDTSALAPGEVAFGKNEVRVGTGSADVVLEQVQAPGKKMMNAADWARGLADDVRAEGMRFQ